MVVVTGLTSHLVACAVVFQVPFESGCLGDCLLYIDLTIEWAALLEFRGKNAIGQQVGLTLAILVSLLTAVNVALELDFLHHIK